MTEQSQATSVKPVQLRIANRNFNVGEKGVKGINARFPAYEVWYEDHVLVFYAPMETTEMKCIVDNPADIQIVRPDQIVGELKEAG